MNVLVINSGSSSFKYQLIDMTTETALCSGLVERIGEEQGKLTHKVMPGTDGEKKFVMEQPFPDHVAGMKTVVDALTDSEKGVIKDKSEIHAVGHRVVQGGETFSKSVVVDNVVKAAIHDNIPLAPLHNPANLAGIDVAQELFPDAPSVAVFDTEFHSTMPAKAYRYAIPTRLYKELKIRRYGFHGTSHRFVTKQAAKFLGKKVEEVNLVTCHLGNGCSMAAVQKGKCIDTSMGMTPLAGLMMGTRCGDIDPAILPFLAENKGLTIKEIDAILNKESGLKGVCGMNDMRDLHTARLEKKDEAAQLAFEMFCYHIKQYIGSYIAIVGPIDAIVFTAGVGENDEHMRAEVCKGLEHLGIEIDLAANDVRCGDPRSISKGGKVDVLIIPTNEELEIAQATVEVLKG